MKFILALIVGLQVIPGSSSRNKNSGCKDIHITNRLVSWGERKAGHPRRITAVIIHSSYNALSPDSFSLSGVLREYKAAGVSPHYLIDRKGTIYRLVPDDDIAFQAGKSHLPDGTTDVNAVSVGIEIINTMNDSPTQAQYVSLAGLVRCLQEEYPIKYVLGHRDIAPGRKTDPWNFDWTKFRSLLGEQHQVK